MLTKLISVTQNSVKFGAEVCAIGAACAGVYAYLNPSVVSDYMVAVADNTRRSAEAAERIRESTEAMSQDTRNIASDTEVLAGAVPNWLSVSDLRVDQLFDEPYFQVDVQNDSPQQIDAVQIVLKGLDGKDVLRFGPYILPQREVKYNRSKVIMERDATLCISGTIAGKGRVSELRTLYVAGNAPFYKVETVDRRIATGDTVLAECQ